MVNYYSFLAGEYIALLPLFLQLFFLFLFAINHEYQKYIGYLIFGLWFLSGIFGFTASCAYSVNQLLSDTQLNSDRLTFISIFQSSIFLTFGSVGLLALKKQKFKELLQPNFLNYFDYKNISTKKAIRDAIIIRIIIFVMSIGFGIILGLFDQVEFATEYAVYLNISEYIFLLIFTTISVVIYAKSQILQSIVLSIFNLIILMIIKFDQFNLLLSTSYVFIISGIMASIYSLVWVKLNITKHNTGIKVNLHAGR